VTIYCRLAQQANRRTLGGQGHANGWRTFKAPIRLEDLAKGDWLGIGLMVLGLPALTFVLEEGQRKDWFGSPVIVQATWLAIFGIAGFIIRELTAAKPFINLRVLKSRSVGAAAFQ
jgi:MFS transporter, DHA2 family, multidrug resistance protein